MLEAVKPKRTKLGTPLESESMRRKSNSRRRKGSSALVAEASLENDENETDLTVEIEVRG